MSGSPINDGGPAFPVDHQFVNPRATPDELKIACGITVRDWFAGQVLAGLMSRDSTLNNAVEWVPQRAYAIADAMIAARQSK